MTMTVDRTAEDLERHLGYLRARACTPKPCLSESTARRIAGRTRAEPEWSLWGPLDAYRCPFAAEHDIPAHAYHVGHSLSLSALTELARLLRARSGNAPGPVDEPAAERLLRKARR